MRIRGRRPHADQLYLSNLLVIFGLGALAVSFCLIAWLVGAAGSLAIAVATLGGIGVFCGALGNLTVRFDLAAAATAHTSTDAAANILSCGGSSVAATLRIVGYVGGGGLATILTGVGLWRCAGLPR